MGEDSKKQKLIEKNKRAVELLIANKELAFQCSEEKKRATELIDAKEKMIEMQAKLIEIQNAYNIEKQLIEQTLKSIGDAVISTDNKKKILFINKVAQEVTGWSQDEAVGKSLYKVFNILDENTRKKGEDIVKKVMLMGETHLLKNNTLLISKDGREILIEDSAAPILNEKGKAIGVVIVFRDYTEKWERLNKIEYLSFHDELTGLYNRRFYEEELKRMDTKRNLPLSLIMGDVNGLKLMNDSFGHGPGDELLKIASHAISEGCRTDDIAARIGGDEFIILLPKTGAVDAVLVIERIQSCYKTERVNGLEISISFGTETKVDESQDINDIYKIAEKRMYKHKMCESSSIKRRTIDLITKTLFEKDSRELTHSKNVSILVEALAKKMAFSLDNIELMRLTGLMHNIGKIGISDKILNKDEKLDEDEYDEVKKHSEIGYSILGSVNEFSGLSNFVLSHHERWDGKGYPRGLKGDEIPIQSRIIALADSYDAMLNERTYKKAFSKDEAIKEIKRCAGTQFDPALVKVFTEQVLKPLQS